MSCPKCGANESYFVPPPLGEPGFFIYEAINKNSIDDLRWKVWNISGGETEEEADTIWGGGYIHEDVAVYWLNKMAKTYNNYGLCDYEVVSILVGVKSPEGEVKEVSVKVSARLHLGFSIG